MITELCTEYIQNLSLTSSVAGERLVYLSQSIPSLPLSITTPQRRSQKLIKSHPNLDFDENGVTCVFCHFKTQLQVCLTAFLKKLWWTAEQDFSTLNIANMVSLFRTQISLFLQLRIAVTYVVATPLCYFIQLLSPVAPSCYLFI